MQHLTSRLLLVAALATVASAQAVIPNGFANAEATSSTGYPFGRGVSPVRVQYIYDSSALTNQSITGPIVINQLRFRANGGAVGIGGTYSNVTVQLSTAPVDYLAATTTFASNHGSNLTTVYAGPVTVAAGAGQTPNNWFVTIPLTTPFVYDPTQGDLNVDIAHDGTGWFGGAGSAHDTPFTATTSYATRVYNLTSATAATGTVQLNVGIVCELGVAGMANAVAYGAGCYNLPTTFYESFTASTFDLQSTTGTNSLLAVPNGIGGYVVQQGSNTWYTPAGANLGLTDDSVSVAQAMPFTFSGPGFSSSSVYVGSNGRLFLSSLTSTSLSGTGSTFVSGGPNIAMLWNDLNPATAGTITAEANTASGGYVVSWNGVAQFGQAANLNTFQVELYPNGSFEMRWQVCATTNAILAGFTQGNTTVVPASRDLSATIPFDTGLGMAPVNLAATGRPIVNTSVNLDTSNIPAATLIGLNLLGFTQINPGLDLGVIGAAGCFQYASLDSFSVGLPIGGTMSASLSIPNLPSLSGLQLYAQSAVLVAGVNALGALTTNGVALTIGTN